MGNRVARSAEEVIFAIFFYYILKCLLLFAKSFSVATEASLLWRECALYELLLIIGLITKLYYRWPL